MDARVFDPAKLAMFIALSLMPDICGASPLPTAASDVQC
jgi:hypothetical protein